MSRVVRFLYLASLAGLLAVPAGGENRGGDPWASWRTPRFSTLGLADGLPHATITSIAQDDNGLMWIGTMGGLVRYDGQRLQTFRRSPPRSSGLPDDYVRSLLMVPGGNLLVGTNVGGLVVLASSTNRFTRIGDEDLGVRIYALSPDRRGGAWIASDRGVSHVSADLAHVEHVYPAGGRAKTRPADRAYSVIEDPDGTLWVGTETGLFTRPRGMPAFQPVRAPDAAASRALTRDIWAIFRDHRGRLWVGTGDSGVVVQEPGQPFRQPPALMPQTTAIGYRTVRSLAEDALGRLWVATDGVGIDIYQPATGEIRNFRNDPTNPRSLASDILRAVSIDRGGGIWVATDLGVSRTDVKPTLAFIIDNAMPDRSRALADNKVRWLMFDRRGRLWAGLSNGKLDVLDRARGQVRHLALQGPMAGQDVRATVELANGDIIAGSRGIARIDPDSFAIRPEPMPGVDRLPILTMREIGGALYVGTYNGLFVRDGRSGHVDHYIHDGQDPASIASDAVRYITSSNGRDVWIGTQGGFSRFDPVRRRFANWNNRVDDPSSVLAGGVGTILQSGGAIWVGTSNGVAHAPIRGGHLALSSFVGAEGLAGSSVSSLLADRVGRVWATSTSGISAMAPGEHGVRTLSARDGVLSSTFYPGAATLTPEGDLLFGGAEGLTVIEIARTQAVTAPGRGGRLVPTVVAVDEAIRPFAELKADGPIRLPTGTHSVRIGFALLDYASPRDIRYSYKLDGFDRDWIDVPAGTPASAIYTNLPGGNYELRLRADVPGFGASRIESREPLIVELAWHERWWVRLAGALALLGAMLMLLQARTLYLRRQARTLEEEIAARTRDLQQANARLDQLASRDALTGLHNRRSIMACLENERKRAARHDRAFSIALLDLDHFKQINDRYGHLAGDAVLKGTADIVVRTLRATDSAARYGGEELLILLPESGIAEAHAVSDRIRQSVAETDFGIEGEAMRITLSGGVACWRRGENLAALIRRADEALYAAKHAGRNAIVSADPMDGMTSA